MARDVVLLDRLGDDFFADAVRVDIRSIPGIDASVISCFEKR